jgi:hypothetical protein
MSFWERRTNHRQYMLVYDNGKSAVRVNGVGVYPDSVHSWHTPPSPHSTTLKAGRSLSGSGIIEPTTAPQKEKEKDNKQEHSRGG